MYYGNVTFGKTAHSPVIPIGWCSLNYPFCLRFSFFTNLLLVVFIVLCGLIFVPIRQLEEFKGYVTPDLRYFLKKIEASPVLKLTEKENSRGTGESDVRTIYNI